VIFYESESKIRLSTVCDNNFGNSINSTVLYNINLRLYSYKNIFNLFYSALSENDELQENFKLILFKNKWHWFFAKLIDTNSLIHE